MHNISFISRMRIRKLTQFYTEVPYVKRIDAHCPLAYNLAMWKIRAINEYRNTLIQFIFDTDTSSRVLCESLVVGRGYK